MLFVRDETIPIPEQYLTLVRFTLAELAQIVTERWSPDRLAEVVRAKEIFGGTVVVDPEAAPSDARSAERQHVLDLAAARDWPMVPLRSGLDIHGTDLAWRAFARSAPPGDLLAARTYLDYLPLPAQEAGENGKPR